MANETDIIEKLLFPNLINSRQPKPVSLKSEPLSWTVGDGCLLQIRHIYWQITLSYSHWSATKKKWTKQHMNDIPRGLDIQTERLCWKQLELRHMTRIRWVFADEQCMDSDTPDIQNTKVFQWDSSYSLKNAKDYNKENNICAYVFSLSVMFFL